MVKTCLLLGYVCLVLLVLANVPYGGRDGWVLLLAPTVWALLAGGVVILFPCQVLRLLLAPLRGGLLLLVWLGTLIVAIARLVLVTLNRMNRDLAGEAHHDR